MTTIKSKYISNIGILLIILGAGSGIIGMFMQKNYYLDAIEFISLGLILFLRDGKIKGEKIIKYILIAIFLIIFFIKMAIRLNLLSIT